MPIYKRSPFDEAAHVRSPAKENTKGDSADATERKERTTRFDCVASDLVGTRSPNFIRELRFAVAKMAKCISVLSFQRKEPSRKYDSVRGA